MKTYRSLFFVCLAALILRLGCLLFVQHPGIGDPNHYYNLGLRLLEGHGFTIDYIWQFYNPPQSIVHPDDFWMPLTGILAAFSMKLFGTTPTGSLIVFVVLGSLLPIMGYIAAKQFGCNQTSSLFAAATIAVLPEFMLNSVRTDTTIPNTIFVVSSILLLTNGLQNGKLWSFITSGIAAGLAYLTRGDNLLLLPMLLVTAIVYGLWGNKTLSKRSYLYIALIPLLAIAVSAPWLIRNLQVGGSFVTPNLGRLFFLTDFRDHYAYDHDFTLQTLLASQTPMQLISKRLFEMAASIKTLYTTLDIFLPVAIFGGVGLFIKTRDKQQWLTLAPTLILLGGMYFFYTLLAPIGNQGGSFKKSYLTLIPLLLPLGAYAMEKVIVTPRALLVTAGIVIVLMGANAVELVRSEARFVSNYLSYMKTTTDAARALPDTNGDGEIILMAQDPFLVRYFGLRSVTIPMGTREDVLEVAKRYEADYIMMPPDRPSLDALYDGTETDPRFVDVRDLPQISVKLFGFQYPGS